MHKVTRDEIDEHVADLKKFQKQLNASVKKVAQMTGNKSYPVEQLKLQQEIMLEQMLRVRATMQFMINDVERIDE